MNTTSQLSSAKPSSSLLVADAQIETRGLAPPRYGRIVDVDAHQLRRGLARFAVGVADRLEIAAGVAAELEDTSRAGLEAQLRQAVT